MTSNFIKTAIAVCALATTASYFASAADAPKKGNRTFTIHYVYHPVGYSEVPGVGKITTLEAAGQIENIKGESPPFKDNMKVKCQMVSIEAGGKGVSTGLHAARLSGGSPGVLQGTYTYILQDENGQIRDTHSVSAGLD